MGCVAAMVKLRSIWIFRNKYVTLQVELTAYNKSPYVVESV